MENLWKKTWEIYQHLKVKHGKTMEDLWNMCGKWMEHVQYENLWKCHYSSIPAYPTKHFETWEFDMVCLCSRMNTAGWINNGGHAPENVREASVMIKSKIKHMMPAEEISPHLGFQAKHDSKYSKVCRSGVPDNLRSLCWWAISLLSFTPSWSFMRENNSSSLSQAGNKLKPRSCPRAVACLLAHALLIQSLPGDTPIACSPSY